MCGGGFGVHPGPAWSLVARDPETDDASPFASLPSIYPLPDDALLVSFFAVIPARLVSGGIPRGKIWQTLRGHTVRGKIHILSMLGLSLALLGCGSGNDYGGQTGYDYLLRCQLVVRGPRTEREIMSAAYCVGAVSALVGVAPLLPQRQRFCFPDDVTAGEAVQVVVAYLESNLSRLPEDFRLLAIAAMRQAWPCK